jgi:hypothetical protein
MEKEWRKLVLTGSVRKSPRQRAETKNGEEKGLLIALAPRGQEAGAETTEAAARQGRSTASEQGNQENWG